MFGGYIYKGSRRNSLKRKMSRKYGRGKSKKVIRKKGRGQTRKVKKCPHCHKKM